MTSPVRTPALAAIAAEIARAQAALDRAVAAIRELDRETGAK